MTATWTHDGGTDANAGNNSANTTADVTAAAAPDVAAVSLANSPGSVKLRPQTTTVTLATVVENLGATPQTFDVDIYDTTSDPTHSTPIYSTTVISLATGQLTLSPAPTWNVNECMGLSLAVHTLTVVVETLPGEIVTANNESTATITFK